MGFEQVSVFATIGGETDWKIVDRFSGGYPYGDQLQKRCWEVLTIGKTTIEYQACLANAGSVARIALMLWGARVDDWFLNAKVAPSSVDGAQVREFILDEVFRNESMPVLARLGQARLGLVRGGVGVQTQDPQPVLPMQTAAKKATR